MKIYQFIYKTAICATAVALLSSCNGDWLDLSPTNGIDEDLAITNSDQLETARTGMYSALKGRNSNYTDYYGANLFVYAEVRGEDLQYNTNYGSNRASFHYTMEYNTADDFTTGVSVWRSPLITISRANRIISAANSGTLSDQSSASSTIEQYKYEAKVLRALAIFDMTRVYGKPYLQDNGASWGGVADTTILQPEAQVQRSTVADCYTQVIKDLTEAISSGALPTTQTTGYINQWAAKALLARVYLTKGDYALALSTSEDIINNSPYTLWSSTEYVDAWAKANANHSKEMIFELSITGSSDWTDRNGIAYLYAENTDADNVGQGYGDIVATKAFVDSLLVDANDVRNNVFLKATSSLEQKNNIFQGNRVYINKFPAIGSEVRYNNVPILRLSEVYLNAAEAAFQTNDKAKAAQYLNAIISNRTTTTSRQVTSANITAQRIYIERRKELVGEGHRYFDALRRGETITRYTSTSDRGWHDILNSDVQSYNTWTSKKQLPLIPAAEVDGNPGIHQNPLYD